MLAVGLTGGILFSGLLMFAGILPTEAESPWGAFVAGPMGMFVGGAFYMGIERSLPAPKVPLVPRPAMMPWARALRWTLLTIVVALGGSVVVGWLAESLGQPVQEQQRVIDIVRGGLNLDLLVLASMAVVAAPIAEEILFRRQLFRRLHQQVGPFSAYVVSALVFAAVHGNLTGVPTYCWLALCFSFAYWRTGRLACAIFVHVGNNAIAMALLVLTES